MIRVENNFDRSIGALLVYDTTRRDSFESLSRWLEETRVNANEKTVLMLIGNKSDLESEYTILMRQGKS